MSIFISNSPFFHSTKLDASTPSTSSAVGTPSTSGPATSGTSGCSAGSAAKSSGDNTKCKVCFKKIGDEEEFKICTECYKPVCEDCSNPAMFKFGDDPLRLQQVRNGERAFEM